MFCLHLVVFDSATQLYDSNLWYELKFIKKYNHLGCISKRTFVLVPILK